MGLFQRRILHDQSENFNLKSNHFLSDIGLKQKKRAFC